MTAFPCQSLTDLFLGEVLRTPLPRYCGVAHSRYGPGAPVPERQERAIDVTLPETFCDFEHWQFYPPRCPVAGAARVAKRCLGAPLVMVYHQQLVG